MSDEQTIAATWDEQKISLSRRSSSVIGRVLASKTFNASLACIFFAFALAILVSHFGIGPGPVAVLGFVLPVTQVILGLWIVLVIGFKLGQAKSD